MKKLTEKELQIMSVLWEHEEVSMRELIEMVPDFKSVSTLVTFVRRLEVHGMITHRELGRRFYLYSAAVTREKYLQTMQIESLKDCFNGSYIDLVSTLVREEKISIEEIKSLIEKIGQNGLEVSG